MKNITLIFKILETVINIKLFLDEYSILNRQIKKKKNEMSLR